MTITDDLTTVRDLDILVGVGHYRVHFDDADGLLVGYRWDQQTVSGLFHTPTCVLWIPLEWVEIVDPHTGRVVA